MSTISVAIATYNEEKNIGECLETVKDWADEIIVVDGGSTDNTVKIAKKYTSKIIITSNPPIFHINKQKAIDKATSEWILQLDADERVSRELKKEILKKIKSKPRENGFWIPRKNYFLGRFLKKGGQYPDYTLRLYRKGKGKLPCKSVHEQAQVEGEVGKLINPLIHWADPTFTRYLTRFNRYTSLLAVELEKDKITLGPFSFFNFFVLKPIFWFFLTFFRYKGFQDGFPGFVFSFFSALRFPTAYIKYWEKKNANRP